MEARHELVLLVLGFALLWNCEGYSYEDLRRLHKNLLINYDKNIIPVKNSSETVRVKFGLALIQLQELDQEKQILRSLVWLRMSWRDAFLTWDPKDYGEADHVKIPYNLIWNPDIVLYNSAHDKVEYAFEPMAIVYSDGTVLFIPQMHLHSTCSVDMYKFPYDTQHCSMKFGSWVYDGFKLDMDFYEGLEALDLNDFIMSNEWNVLNSGARKNVKYYPCCQEPYPDLTFNITIARVNTGHHRYTLVGPSIVLALLIPVVFLLPSGSTAKTTLGMGVIVGHILLSIMVQSMLPRTGFNVFSLLAVYNLMCVALAGISLLFNAIVNGMWWKVGEVPAIVRSIVIEKVGLLVCVFAHRDRRASEDAIIENDSKERSKKKLDDWQLLSVILNRFLLIIFIICVIIITSITH